MMFTKGIGNTYAENPNICPHCHFANEPAHLFHSEDTKQNLYLSIWKCNYNKCGKLFAVSHKLDGTKYMIDRYLNGLPKGPIWPKPIFDLKNGNSIGTENITESKFIKTYLQSLEAESQGFDEIAGMGYRKAIEYLVKDWAINAHPKEKDKILNSWLSQIINDFFVGDLKDILERATWLGNDQTHYNKLFEEFNIDHLKELIDLILVELDREFKKRHYIETIEKRK